MDKNIKFEVWTDNGKFYYKDSESGIVREITKEEFQQLLENGAITSLEYSSNQTLGLKELIDHFQNHQGEKTSEFGRRVKVVILEEKQTELKDGNGVDVYFKLDILDEKLGKSSDDLYTITSEIEGINGPLVDRGIYFPELFRAMYQLAFNGHLANNDDFSEVKRALKNE